ncbi:hypothetical protein, partial [Candidatus Methylacidiphilum fumarolicum]
FSEIKRLMTWITHSNLNGIIMDISEDKKNFRSQHDSSKAKYSPSSKEKSGSDYKMHYNKDIYVYTCPSTEEKAIKKIVAIRTQAFRSHIKDGIGAWGFWGYLWQLQSATIVITIIFDENKVACSPEEFIKGFGLQNQRLKSNGSLELPKQGSNNRISVRCTFNSNNLNELQFSANKNYSDAIHKLDDIELLEGL